MLSSPRKFSNFILDIKPDELGNAIRLGIDVLNSVPAERLLPPMHNGVVCQLHACACCARVLARVWLARAGRKRRAEHGFADEGTCISARECRWRGGQATVVPKVYGTTGESVILGVSFGVRLSYVSLFGLG